ncbi:MAG: SAP domain-containing protein [Desulfobacterales bacterium]|nr:SAP domain-containing protein [Desulfobacterales bacterium]
MRFQDIQRMAKAMDINTYRMKKTDIIQAIQRKENNIDCYGTNRVESCEEVGCLWRSDCLSSNDYRKPK